MVPWKGGILTDGRHGYGPEDHPLLVVVSREEYEAWSKLKAEHSTAKADAVAEQRKRVFARHGCLVWWQDEFGSMPLLDLQIKVEEMVVKMTGASGLKMVAKGLGRPWMK